MGLRNFMRSMGAAKVEVEIDAILKRHFGFAVPDEDLQETLQIFARPGPSNAFTVAFFCAANELFNFVEKLDSERKLDYGRNWLVTARHARVNDLAIPDAIDTFLRNVKAVFDLKTDDLDGMQAELNERSFGKRT